RRHTRFSRHWSSDVCSSDLGFTLGLGCGFTLGLGFAFSAGLGFTLTLCGRVLGRAALRQLLLGFLWLYRLGRCRILCGSLDLGKIGRARVGKERRSRWSALE